MTRKKLLLLTTGGTIASAATSAGFAPQFSGEELIAAMNNDSSLGGVELAVEDTFSLDSCNISPNEWQAIARRVSSARQDYDGIIITHGTDTMAYTAAALYYMLENINLPVVITGSQRTLGEPESDAPSNLKLAILMAMSDRSGVYVAFGGRVIIGKAAKKLYTANLDGFRSINCPDVAIIKNGRLHFNPDFPDNNDRGAFKMHEAIHHKVGVLYLVPGMTADSLRQLVDTGSETIILVAFGMGGVAGADASEVYNILPAIQYAADSGVQVVITSQCPYDGVDLTHYVVGRDAMKLGVINGGRLTLEALYAKAILGLL